jgi:hypothetical protein
MRRLIFFLGFMISLAGLAQVSPGLFLGGRAGLKGGVFVFYDAAGQEPSVLVRLGRAYTDYERRGFFRIGALPIGVMEGVTFEVYHPDSATNGLGQLHEWLEASAAKRTEIRHLEFIWSAATTNRLEISRARFDGRGSLVLLDGVRFLSGANEMHAPGGSLQLTGEHSGRLVLTTQPPWTNSLFAHTATANVPTRERIP